MIKAIARAVLPKPVRKFLRQLWGRWVFWRAMRRFVALSRGDTIPSPLLEALVYGWGNEIWSAQVEYLQASLEQAWLAEGPILECGSGLSTILLGVVCNKTGNSLLTLEHMPQWARRVQRVLNAYHLGRVVLHAVDLVQYDTYAWYDTSLLLTLPKFGLVICDGPPGDTLGGRYGLLPVMGQHLQAKAVILLDDAQRPGEQEVLQRWASEFGLKFTMVGTSKPLAVLQYDHSLIG